MGSIDSIRSIFAFGASARAADGEKKWRNTHTSPPPLLRPPPPSPSSSQTSSSLQENRARQHPSTSRVVRCVALARGDARSCGGKQTISFVSLSIFKPLSRRLVLSVSSLFFRVCAIGYVLLMTRHCDSDLNIDKETSNLCSCCRSASTLHRCALPRHRVVDSSSRVQLVKERHDDQCTPSLDLGVVLLYGHTESKLEITHLKGVVIRELKCRHKRKYCL